MSNSSNGDLITMSAGPNSIHDRIRLAYARQLRYHYDPDFHALFDDSLEKLRQVYQTSGDVVIMQGEAVLGLEAASACTVRPGDLCLNLVSGVFGAGYARYFRRYSGHDPLEIIVPYNAAIDPADVEKLLKEHNLRALAVVHSETPSGTLNPVAEICALAREHGVLTIVDAVSSIGGMPVPVDEWGADIVVGGPHKCLGAAPGSALMAISHRAWEAMLDRDEPLRRSYLSILDWKEMWLESRRFPFTVFVGQINGLNEALSMVLEEGLQERFDRHTQAAQMTRMGVRALGLELWPVRETIASTCVTAVSVPEGLDAHRLLAHMRNRYGLVIAGSLKELEGKVVRIGHMGHMARPSFVQLALGALERSLLDLGFPVTLGSGVGAALSVA